MCGEIDIRWIVGGRDSMGWEKEILGMTGMIGVFGGREGVGDGVLMANGGRDGCLYAGRGIS